MPGARHSRSREPIDSPPALTSPSRGPAFVVESCASAMSQSVPTGTHAASKTRVNRLVGAIHHVVADGHAQMPQAIVAMSEFLKFFQSDQDMTRIRKTNCAAKRPAPIGVEPNGERANSPCGVIQIVAFGSTRISLLWGQSRNKRQGRGRRTVRDAQGGMHRESRDPSPDRPRYHGRVQV